MRKLVVTSRTVAQLVPYAKNARTHSDEQVAQIAASITEYGWTNPVLIDEDGGIIAGHGRVLAARLLEHSKVPCIVLSGLTAAQKSAYVLADNKLALNAGWDEQLLKLELSGLEEMGFDLNLSGFSQLELKDLFATPQGPGEPLEGDTPPLPATPISRPGDLWLLGRHRIICGDSTRRDVVDRLLDGAKPQLMVTDPLYGVEYDAAGRNTALRADGSNPNGRAIGPVSNDDRADWREAWALFPGDVAYVWHAAGRLASAVQTSLEAAGFEIRCQLVWVKQQFSIGRGNYHWQHEPCWYAVRKGKTAHWAGDRKQTTVWDIPKPQKSETGHSTQKPVLCMLRPMLNNSQQGELVYDPFLGSGTTLIAAVQAGRFAYGAEIDPRYVDVAIRRWQAFTGATALCESVSFAERELSPTPPDVEPAHTDT